MPSPIHAVLFDLDGTLVDNMPFHIAAWLETGRALDCELTREQILSFAGRKNEEILPIILGRPLDPEELARFADQKEARYRELYTGHIQLHAGADKLLHELAARGVACAIASAAPRDNRKLVLEATQLTARMGAVVGAEEVKNGKPAPDLFLEAARRLGANPANTLVFEDAVAGVQAGLAAGMRVCGITTSEPAEKLLAAGALAAIPDFHAVPTTLSTLFGGLTQPQR
ncbi:MAG TPA: HAD family phosphatase [Polyangiales bacterium]|nr:HAD family phosphatase [Polyangiales bacterium]